MPHGDGSPYQCLSAHAGNPAFIDIQWLKKKGWLQAEEGSSKDASGDTFVKMLLISQSHFQILNHWLARVIKNISSSFVRITLIGWIDFALFFSLRQEYENQCWNQWPEL